MNFVEERKFEILVSFLPSHCSKQNKKQDKIILKIIQESIIKAYFSKHMTAP